MRTRSSLSSLGSLVSVLGAGAVIAWSSIELAACSPGQSQNPESAFDAGSGGSGGGSGGTGGSGGGIFGDSGFDVGFDVPVSPSCKSPTDTDGDFVADDLELAPTQDTDHDGTADYLDDDSDGDGWLDKDEAANPNLPVGAPGQSRPATCSALADSDEDTIPDVRDLDSDNDGIPDADERAYDASGASGCRVKVDCDGDGYDDVIEVAAGANPNDPASTPPPDTLFFVLPYGSGEKYKDFQLSSALKNADIYFLVDSTRSMQATIEAVAASLDTTILPKILNGDATTHPPSPPIPGARVGVGDFRDVPWLPWGNTGDELYRSTFDVDGRLVSGALAAPVGQAPAFTAPKSVRDILEFLSRPNGAAGGGDAPEGMTQAMWLALTGSDYLVYGGGGPWSFGPTSCPVAGQFGAACFDPDALPVFVLISDAQFHDGPTPVYNYYETDTPGTAQGVVHYDALVQKFNDVGAKFVGVALDTGTPGAARSDMEQFALATGSLWHDDAFGGSDKPIVTSQDTASGSVSDEVVRLVGLLAGLGLKNVTTKVTSYSCAGGVDCNSDGKVDPHYANPIVPPDTAPYDASLLVEKVVPQPSPAPAPYDSLDQTTFYKVKGEASLTFRVYARNDVLRPTALTVVEAKLQVQTPKGQKLGGADGTKVIYFVVPKYVPSTG